MIELEWHKGDFEGPNSFTVSYTLRFDFPATNNMTEYKALINGMKLAMGIGVSDLKVLSDWQLVVNQIRGIYEAWDETMKQYLVRVQELQHEFELKGIPLWVDLIP